MCTTDVYPVEKRSRRAEREVQSGEQSTEVYPQTAVYRGVRYRASGAPSQLTTSTDHYLEIVETPSNTDHESTGDNDHYDRPDDVNTGTMTQGGTKRWRQGQEQERDALYVLHYNWGTFYPCSMLSLKHSN